MPTFTTEFTPPPEPSGLVIEADLEASAIRLSWDPTTILEADFDGYRVYRSEDGVTWELLATLTGVNDVSYDDFEAALNKVLSYRVTQSNVDFESAPAEGSAELVSRTWWAVTPDDGSLTFPIPKVRGASMTSPKVQEVYSPIGRPTRIVVGDVVQTEEGELSFLVMPDQPGQVALLKRLQARMDGVLILKAPDGVVHRVQYGDMTRSFTRVEGLQEVTIPFIGAG